MACDAELWVHLLGIPAQDPGPGAHSYQHHADTRWSGGPVRGQLCWRRKERLVPRERWQEAREPDCSRPRPTCVYSSPGLASVTLVSLLRRTALLHISRFNSPFV